MNNKLKMKLIIKEGREENLFNGIIDKLDSKLPDWNGDTMKTFNEVARAFEHVFKGIHHRLSTDLAMDYQAYRQGHSDKKKTVAKMVKRMKPFSKKKESVVMESNVEPEVITALRKIVKDGQYGSVKDPVTNKKIKVDLFSASSIVAVYDKLSDKNKNTYANSPIQKMAKIAFKLMK